MILSTETKYKDPNNPHKNIYEVKEFPKTRAGFRRVIIPEDYVWIIDELRKLRPFATYLATNAKGERMTTNTIRMRLYRICNWLGFDMKKSPHKSRKTYISILLDGKYDNNFVINQVGHINITTSERFYHFDRKSEQEKQDIVNNIEDFKIS